MADFPPEKGQLDFPFQNATGTSIYLRHTLGPGIVQASIVNSQPNYTAYDLTYVYSIRQRRRRLARGLIFTIMGGLRKMHLPRPGSGIKKAVSPG